MRIVHLTIIGAVAVILLLGCQNNGPVAIGKFGYGSANITVNITQPQDQSVVRTSPVTVSGSAPEGIKVMINGNSVTMDNNRFSASVSLETGPNIIEVLARDSRGGETSRYIHIVYVP